MEINEKKLKRYLLDDLDEISCIYVNSITKQMALESDNGCVLFKVTQKDGSPIVKMKHTNKVEIIEKHCSEVITNTYLADINISELSVEIFLEDDSIITFKLEPKEDRDFFYNLSDLELVTNYKPKK